MLDCVVFAIVSGCIKVVEMSLTYEEIALKPAIQLEPNLNLVWYVCREVEYDCGFEEKYFTNNI